MSDGSWDCWYIAGRCDHEACGEAGGFLHRRTEPGPTTEDYCASGGHTYYGDDSGIGSCYCGAKSYPAAARRDTESGAQK